jgi:hypothetical protein
MKKSLFAFLCGLLTIPVCGSAQVYTHALAPDPSVWLTDIYNGPYGNSTSCPPHSYCYSYAYFLLGDTVLSGIAHKKLYKSDSLVFFNNGVTQYYTQRDTVKKYMGGIREDSTHEILYINTPALGRDTVMYNFNLHPGDTIKPSYIGLNGFIVKSIDSVRYGTIWYKQINTTCGVYFVKSVGTGTGFLEGAGCFMEGGAFLRCFTPGVSRISQSSCGAFPLGIDAKDEHPPFLIIGPNPSHGVFQAHNRTTGPMHFTISDVQGRTIQSGLKSGADFEFNLNTEPAGVYFLRRWEKTGATYTCKLSVY